MHSVKAFHGITSTVDDFEDMDQLSIVLMLRIDKTYTAKYMMELPDL